MSNIRPHNSAVSLTSLFMGMLLLSSGVNAYMKCITTKSGVPFNAVKITQEDLRCFNLAGKETSPTSTACECAALSALDEMDTFVFDGTTCTQFERTLPANYVIDKEEESETNVLAYTRDQRHPENYTSTKYMVIVKPQTQAVGEYILDFQIEDFCGKPVAGQMEYKMEHLLYRRENLNHRTFEPFSKVTQQRTCTRYGIRVAAYNRETQEFYGRTTYRTSKWHSKSVFDLEIMDGFNGQAEHCIYRGLYYETFTKDGSVDKCKELEPQAAIFKSGLEPRFLPTFIGSLLPEVKYWVDLYRDGKGTWLWRATPGKPQNTDGEEWYKYADNDDLSKECASLRASPSAPKGYYLEAEKCDTELGLLCWKRYGYVDPWRRPDDTKENKLVYP